jgi:hypothetical protein
VKAAIATLTLTLGLGLGVLPGCGLEEIDRSRPRLGLGDASTGPQEIADGGGGAVAGVTIAGVARRKDDVIVFLHVGHSNMAGRASGPEELRGFNYDVHPQLWSYGRDGFVPAREPLAADSLTAGRAGPGMSILRTALAAAPTRIMVSIGHGQSGPLGGYCRSYRRGGLLYDIVMRPALELKGKVTFGAIFTMLGVSEVDDPTNLNAFATCLQAVAGDMRADLGEPDLPFLIGDWEVGSTDEFVPTGMPAMILMPQLRQAATVIPHAALISGDMLEMADPHHYDFAGHKLWAERGFALLRQQRWMPWAAP